MHSGQNVLVTGGAGFLGSHVVDRAMAEGCNVYCVDNLYTGRESNVAHHRTNPRFHFIRHDVTAPFPASVTAVKFDYIFHLACPASPVHYQAEPIATTLTCVNGTNNVLQLAQQAKCPVLIASTSEVYGDPDVHPQPESYHGNVSCTGIRSCYDEGKRAAEALAFDYNRKHGVQVRVARIFNTYGPRMCADDGRVVSNFAVQALANKDITIFGDGSNTRSFQYVTDLIDAFWLFILHATEIGPINLGNPNEFTIKEAAELIKGMVPASTSIITYLPATQDDPKQRKPDISKAAHVLGWSPKVSFKDGLKPTIDYFRGALTPANCDRVYVECNPLLDISAHVDADFLAKYNVPPAAAALCSPEQVPIYADLEKKEDVKYIPGGSGLNTARVAQWMSAAPKGRFITYVGSIADDAHGRILKQSAESEGVTMAVQYCAKAPTGTCAVCIVGKERSLVANLAAANELTVSHLETPTVSAAIAEARIFYFTAFTLTISEQHLLSVARRAALHDGIMCMNLSAPFLMQFFSAQLNTVLPHIDVIFSNEDEAAALAAMLKLEGDHTDLRMIAKAAAALPKQNTKRPRLVIFTAGKHSTVYATADGQVGEVPVAPIDPSKIIDTNGAGDAFVGGFLAGYARRLPVEQCIKAGHYSAGVVIQHDGCTFPAVPEYTL